MKNNCRSHEGHSSTSTRFRKSFGFLRQLYKQIGATASELLSYACVSELVSDCGFVGIPMKPQTLGKLE
jgi:hypothetical protein